MSDDQWFYCLKHQTVEQGTGCGNLERMGPYGTREEAERSLTTAAERTQAWDEDPKWSDD